MREQEQSLFYYLRVQLDDRDQVGYVSSRIGVSREAIQFLNDTPIYEIVEGQAVKPYCILIDESQFLSKQHILELARIVDELNIPVMAFGLKNDFQNELFEGLNTYYFMLIKSKKLKRFVGIVIKKQV